MGTLSPQFGSLIPSQTQQLLATNYLQFTNNGGGAGIPANFADFAQQYLPEVYEQEVERYGNRTLSGFLRMVGAEMPMTSDQVIWSEQNRLHIAYDGCTRAGNVITLPVGANNAVRVNQTVVVSNGIVTVKCIVSAVTAGPPATVTALPYTATG